MLKPATHNMVDSSTPCKLKPVYSNISQNLTVALGLKFGFSFLSYPVAFFEMSEKLNNQRKHEKRDSLQIFWMDVVYLLLLIK